MLIKSILRRGAIITTLFYLIPALACNFPVPTESSGSIEELRITLITLADLVKTEQTTEPAGIGATATSPAGTETAPTPSTEGDITATPPNPVVFPLQTQAQDESGTHFIYFTQTGDTLPTIAKRFRVDQEQVSSSQPIAPDALLPSGIELQIPNNFGETQFSDFTLPDSEIIYSPSTTDFLVGEFINNAGGYLSTYSEEVNGKLLSAAEIVQKVAAENLINPRLLLAVLEYRAGWVYGEPEDPAKTANPIGFYVPDHKGLYYELVLTATHLGVGYYGWRMGSISSVTFSDDGTQGRYRHIILTSTY